MTRDCSCSSSTNHSDFSMPERRTSRSRISPSTPAYHESSTSIGLGPLGVEEPGKGSQHRSKTSHTHPRLMNLTDDRVSSTGFSARQVKDALAARRFEQLAGLLAREIVQQEVARELLQHVGDHQVGRRVGLLYHVAPLESTVAKSLRKCLVIRSVRGLSRHASSRWLGNESRTRGDGRNSQGSRRESGLSGSSEVSGVTPKGHCVEDEGASGLRCDPKN